MRRKRLLLLRLWNRAADDRDGCSGADTNACPVLLLLLTEPSERRQDVAGRRHHARRRMLLLLDWSCRGGRGRV